MPDAFDSLPSFNRGEPLSTAITADKLNAIVRAIRALRPMSGNGVLVRTSPSGTVMSAMISTEASTTTPPFDLTSPSATTVTISTGTVNNVIPTNVNTPLTITGVGVEYVTLTMSATNAKVVSSSFSITTSSPAAISVVQGQPPSSFSVCTHVLVDGSSSRVIGSGSLVFTPYEAWRLAKVMVSPDSMPYDSYYSWRASLI